LAAFYRKVDAMQGAQRFSNKAFSFYCWKVNQR